MVGARSAVFAPTPHLGLIVLDEEHEATFKQESAPRYHARDVALARAAARTCRWCSARPRLRWKAGNGADRRSTSCEMPRRVLDRPLPTVGTIDSAKRSTREQTRAGAISRPLHAAMNEALDAGGQVILLLNRRGFSTHIQCPACGAWCAARTATSP